MAICIIRRYIYDYASEIIILIEAYNMLKFDPMGIQSNDDSATWTTSTLLNPLLVFVLLQTCHVLFFH